MVLKNSAGLTLEAMGELEYYVLYDNQPHVDVKEIASDSR